MGVFETKGLLSSATIWGALISFAPLINEVAQAIPEAQAILVGAVGGLLAIFGRIKAKTKIRGVV